ncbi:MAG TPA: hypothetical protein PKJ37_07960 [Acidobacteriota bacterium]|nr:hypothetical protein [Acidobacteriota bacterium]HNT17809.1 hypothetical protein [Acidobacteriota bacterium]
MKPWRLAAVLSISLMILLGLVGVIAYRNRGDLSFLFMDDSALKKPLPAKKPPPEPHAPLPQPVKVPAPPVSRTLSIENIRVLPYEGVNGGFLPVINGVSGLSNSLSSSARLLGAGGLAFPSAEDRIEIVPVDSGRLSSPAPYEVVQGVNGAPSRILVPVEQLALRHYPSEELLASALAETIMTRRSRSFAEAPEFLRHGLALYLSGFGDYYERRFILLTDREAPQMVLPLSDTSSYAWADGFWAIRALRDQRGAESVRLLVNSLEGGESWKPALESACGTSFDAFQDAYRAFVLNYLSSVMANRPAFKKAVRPLRETNEKEAYAALLDFVRNHPSDLYAGEARYYTHYAEYRLGKAREAIDGFLDLLNNAPFTTASQGKAHYFLGRSYELRKYGTLALIEYRLASLEDNGLLGKAVDKRLKELEK